MYALSIGLFGVPIILPEFPIRKDLLGIGLSDSDLYAEVLIQKIGYKNTFYHREPFVDIANPDPKDFGRFDFVISSDVFEHVPPPIRKAFEGAKALLKPGGVLIFSVPYVEGETVEHYPDLNRFSIEKRGPDWILSNVTSSGQQQEFRNPTFHGGPGTTLEMRLFGRQSLEAEFEKAGYSEVQILEEEVPEFGIYWNEYVAENARYRPLIHGLDTPPWIARR